MLIMFTCESFVWDPQKNNTRQKGERKENNVRNVFLD